MTTTGDATPGIQPSTRPAAAHGRIALDAEACTACDLCAVECPVWCIDLTSHTEVRAEGPGRPRKVKVLDDFTIDFGLCMFCGICVQVCPFDALAWAPEAVVARLTETQQGAALEVQRSELEAWWARPPGSEHPRPADSSG